MTAAEYRIAHLYMLAKASQEESGQEAGEGIEIIRNEAYTEISEINKHGLPAGQYTEKIFHLKSKLPRFVAMLMPDTMTDIVEYSWNSFPRYRTEFHNAFFGDKVVVSVDTMHADDRGTLDNAARLSDEDLVRRKVDYINIACDDKNVPFEDNDDPRKVMSVKTGRGELKKDFWEYYSPIMTCYKVVKFRFKVFPIQSKVESWGQQVAFRNTFLKYHRKLFCWIDEWYGLTIEDIRKMEDETARITKEKIEASKKQQLEQQKQP